MPETRPPAIRQIVIVGGGSAGWMTAAALSSLLPADQVGISLVESEQIGTIGVGEATIPDIINFNALLGIPETDFLKATNGTFKLGIRFLNWGGLGEDYIHPFGQHGVDMNGIDFHQFWLRYKADHPGSTIEEFSLSAVAAKSGKFTMPDANPRSVLSQLRYAYHFDATAYAAYLRNYAEQRGVQRIEGRVTEVHQDAQTGNITAIDLDNGQSVAGDLFFDCTGFHGLLIEKTLGVPFRDWSHWLPCDTAQAVACERGDAILPYTVSTAKTAGWQWRIPTQHRTGNGHIYASHLLSDDEAIDSLLKDLDGDVIGSPRKIRFRTGHRAKFWEKNCVAVGLSGGFLEPLESTSLFLIQEGISKFIALFPAADMPSVVRDEYNRQLVKKFEQVRDFIILHYKATTRDDSPFWNYTRTMDIPDSLTDRIELFREAGRVFRYEDELFSKPSWVAVMMGQNIVPKSIDPIVRTVDPAGITRSLQSMKSAMTSAVSNMQTHRAFLETYAWSGKDAERGAGGER
ncbi:tryptophan halogenase family protein [Hyphobacterium sp. HN65]|uniref:Tryptophan halogenase family protein n=1 Tax=Hyphobacterium lacteum TaxID=3116575 RepID=A0ABU7LSF6_9PROT|nr:tryptophan halogenase family protein [Hyphobacterium sp. HN65]MEE2526836.1 tryptophan halogenase family protein [Hyphobacterium sp. HN65]